MSKSQSSCKNYYNNKTQNRNNLSSSECMNSTNEALLNNEHEKKFESLSISITQEEINDLKANSIINEYNREIANANNQHWQVKLFQ